jgi:predicted nuclease of predicted toxin-antitoxin system
LKFLVDNALSPLIAEGLRSAGHNAIHIRDYNMQKATDLEVMSVMEEPLREGSIIVIEEKRIRVRRLPVR